MLTILNRKFPNDISEIIFNYVKIFQLEIIMEPKLYMLELHLDSFNYTTYYIKNHNFDSMIDKLNQIYNILHFANKYNYKFDKIFENNINKLIQILEFQKPYQKNTFIKIIINKILLTTKKNYIIKIYN